MFQPLWPPCCLSGSQACSLSLLSPLPGSLCPQIFLNFVVQASAHLLREAFPDHLPDHRIRCGPPRALAGHHSLPSQSSVAGISCLFTCPSLSSHTLLLAPLHLAGCSSPSSVPTQPLCLPQGSVLGPAHLLCLPGVPWCAAGPTRTLPAPSELPAPCPGAQVNLGKWKLQTRAHFPPLP